MASCKPVRGISPIVAPDFIEAVYSINLHSEVLSASVLRLFSLLAPFLRVKKDETRKKCSDISLLFQQVFSELFPEYVRLGGCVAEA